jgi:uncharacterized membrane protein YkoI
MRHLAYSLALTTFMLAACSSQEKMARSALLSMPEAVQAAEASVPGGRATKSHLEKQGDRTVYEVELVDNQNYKRTVWVDAYSGGIVKKTEP